MSYTYLQEQGEEYLVESFADIPQFVLSRLNLTAEKSYSKDNEMESYQSSQSGTTCKHSTETHGEEKLTSSAEVSHAKTYQQQEKEQELKDQDQVCGNTWRESSVKFDLNTHSWKTHRCLWEEDLAPSSLTLPKWGMMQSGVLWERITSPLHTDETEFGSLLPTPTCADATMGAILNDNTKLIMLKSGKLRKISNQGVSGSIGLARTVAMWPTPRAGNPGSRPNGKGGKILSEEVLIAEGIRNRGETFATPQARDFRTGSTDRWDNPERSRNLNDQIGGQLNPTWVEWLMGWPLGWTDCAASATDKFQQWLNSHGKH
jgi:hypothetical protein